MTGLTLARTSVGGEDLPVVVLGNSLGTTTSIWDPQLDSLLTRFRVVRWDLPGHGRSPSPSGPFTIADLGEAVVAMIDELGVATAAYCGASLGGMVGMAAAAAHPDRLVRLVLCCTSAHLPGSASAWEQRAATVRQSGTDAIVAGVVGRWFTPAFSKCEPALLSRLTAAFVAVDAEGYARCCEALAALDLRPHLGLITAPTLVIAGADDDAIPARHGAAIAASVAGARFVCIDHAAHMATVERADVITPLLLENLATS